MNRDSANKLWPIIKAFGEGKAIMCTGSKYDEPDADLAFNSDPSFYTIVPEPKYRPFKNAEEFAPNRDRWVKMKSQGCESVERVVFYTPFYVGTELSDHSRTYAEFMRDYVFADDGSPCGVLDTEGVEA